MSSPHPPVTLPDTEVRLLESALVNDTYRLHISLPITYANSDRTYPVVYLTDGNGLFPLVRCIAEALSGGLEIPRLIIVGIGYDTDNAREWGRYRERDLLPTNASARDASQRCVDQPLDPGYGGCAYLRLWLALSIFSMTLTAESARILPERDPAKVVAQLDRLRELSKDALAEMRSLISQLRPETVAEEGLIPALRRHIAERQNREEGLNVALHLEGCEEGERPLALETEEGLYRIVQEALNNVVKHAQTDRVEARLRLTDDAVSLLIEDHGVGFDLSRTGPEGVHPQASHLGLTSMRERAKMMGATFAVESQPGSGTRIRVKKQLGESLLRS